MTISDKLKELRELAERASEGPWWTEASGGTGPHGDCEVRAHVGMVNESPTVMIARVHPFNRQDADLISASRTAVPALCSALERAVEALEFIRGAANGQEARASSVPAEFVEATLSDIAKLLEAK